MNDLTAALEIVRPFDAIFTADTHLQSGAWAGLDIEGDALYAFDWTIRLATEAGCSAIILGGDVTDKQRNRSQVADAMRRGMDVCQAANIPVYFIQGQPSHDSDVPPWLSSVHSWPIHLHMRQVEIAGFRVTGLDYQSSATLVDALNSIPADTQILVAHQSWAEWMGEDRSQGSLTDVTSAQVVMTGDYHKTEVLKFLGKDGRTRWAWSPGSTCLQAQNEPAEKYLFAFSKADQPGAPRKVRIPGRSVIEIRVDNPEELDYAVKALPGQMAQAAVDSAILPLGLRRPIVRVHYRSDLTDAMDRLTAVAAEAHFFENPYLVEGEKSTLGSLPEATDSLEEALSRRCDRETEPVDYDLGTRLLRSDEPATVLKEWLKERMGGGHVA